jgi:hypothetical protein
MQFKINVNIICKIHYKNEYIKKINFKFCLNICKKLFSFFILSKLEKGIYIFLNNYACFFINVYLK